MMKPREFMVALQEAATETVNNMDDPALAKLLRGNELQVGFEDSVGEHTVSPRGLSSEFLNKLVVVEGIVTKCSSVRPKLVRSVQYCPATKQYLTRDFRDATALDIGIEVKGRERLPTASVLPNKDNDGNALEFEQGLSLYKDYQSIVLQEMPERARVGQLPRSVDVILEHDLVDRVKPGDRVQCVGVYRPLPSVSNGNGGGIFKTVLIGNNVSVIGKEIGAVKLSGRDVANIRCGHNTYTF
jgi:DNA replication licensing factor MCM3